MQVFLQMVAFSLQSDGVWPASSDKRKAPLLESSSTEAKVVIVNPGGRVETFSSFHDKTKSIIVNLCRKKWKTVANLTFCV